ncbi:PRTRC system protein E [Deinococcus multiflagellatus]|uniref:PRTRC system protein E n=1 Tax=Deinococcus multiflagellatus TaxID=1656887 RepID=A0ABW1ZS79_9DEIO|nr:PRTRC system protein E [Deinococcus multiflagellatus]MBZ9714474.1 PRTRC system protein E [Deinococcus multiflagellatus]
MTHTHQPIPEGHIRRPQPAAFETNAEIRDYLVGLYESLSTEGKAEFTVIIHRYPNWTQDAATGNAVVRAIHEGMVLTMPAPQPDPFAVFTPAAPLPTAVAPTAAPAPTPPAPAVAQAPVPAPAPSPSPEPATVAPPTVATPSVPVPTEEDSDVEASEPDETPADEGSAVGSGPAANPDGLFSQLHAMAADGEMIVLYVQRQGDLLDLKLVPSGAKGEAGKAIDTVQVKATPAELDSDLASALTTYTALRQSTRQALVSVSQQVKQSVGSGKGKAKSAAKPASSAPATGVISINANVTAYATIKGPGFNEKDRHPVGPEHKEFQAKPGTYTVTVHADGHLPETFSNCAVTAGKTQHIQAQLKNAGLGF